MALLLVATTAASAIALVQQAAAVDARGAQHERRLREADRLLASVSLWPRDEIDRHLGVRPQGPWVLEIQQRAPGLYDVVVLEKVTARVWLQSALYRPSQP